MDYRGVLNTLTSISLQGPACGYNVSELFYVPALLSSKIASVRLLGFGRDAASLPLSCPYPVGTPCGVSMIQPEAVF